jgi:hypothetical protein
VTRPGLTDEAAKLLAQRLVRPDAGLLFSISFLFNKPIL